MRVTLTGVLAAAVAVVAFGAPAAAAATVAAPRAAGAQPAGSHVVIVGIGGLRWSDISARATPALWRLAGQGSDGSLIVRAANNSRTCPADDWLTLNAAAKAAVPHGTASCPADPAVVPAHAGGTPGPARIPAMRSLVSFNTQYSQNPQWGLLASGAGPGGCATAVGPGGALALAGPGGQVGSYLPSAAGLTRADLARCRLTVIDLGHLPPSTGPGGPSTRAAALAAADRRIAAIEAAVPAGSTLMVISPAAALTPHLQTIIISGPGYRSGLLEASSTRQPGLIVMTDLTPTVLGWLGVPVPPVTVGSHVRSSPRGALAGTTGMLAGQDVAAQVYRSTLAPFYLVVGFGDAAVFALIFLVPWGREEERRARRRALARVFGVFAASVPAGSFLASLVPWWSFPHPALALYSLTVAWALAVAAAALAGPWRRDPLGPVGAVATVTLLVIALDLMTGSHLQPETPFGLSLLMSARYYGLGNNAVLVYAASGILSAVWLGGVARRRGGRGRGLAAMAAVLAFTVVVAGWPGFGAKVGGTIAMVICFLLLLAFAADIRITPTRAVLVAVSGVAVVTAFALINYFVPVIGRSDIGGFVGQALHGGAGSILQRKIGSNLHSVVESPFAWIIPVAVVALGSLVAWPARLRVRPLARAYEELPLLRPTLSAIWLVAVLGWFAEDSGVTVAAAGLPLVLPLVIVILVSLPGRGGSLSHGTPAPGSGGWEASPGTGEAARASGPAPGPGQPGYR